MNTYVGLDIGKNKIDACILKEDTVLKEFSFSNNSKGFEDLLKELVDKTISMVVLEPTGGYENSVSDFLFSQGYQLHRVNTYSFSHFSRSVNLCKNDRKDAYKLALFAQRMMCKANYRNNKFNDTLKSYHQRREDLVLQLSSEKKRLQQTFDDTMKCLLKTHIDFLQRQIKAIDKLIEDLLKSDQETAERAELLSSVPGIGTCIATKLVAFLPELGDENIKPEQLVALAGLAPYSRDSGKKSGKRFIRGGRKIPRDALYMAVLTGKHKIPFLKNLYDRLSALKPKKVAMVAAMRNLLIICHKLTKNNRRFVCKN